MKKNMKRIVQTLTTAKSIKAGIQLIKNQTQIKDINEIFSEVHKIIYYRKSLLGNTFPKTIESFPFSSSVYPASDLQKELIWTSNIIARFATSINRFNDLREKYLKELLFSRYEQANLILDSIEEEFGVSFWLIENRISLLQISDGLEKQKEFTQNIIENEKANITIRFITRFLSIKAEKNVAPQKYNKEIKATFSELDESPYNDPYLYYLKFKINLSEVERFDYREILQIENELSIIDRYLTFIEVLLNLKVTNELDLNEHTIKQLSENLEGINDESLRNFWILEYGVIKNSFVEERKELIKVYDAYSLGEYSLTIKLAEEILCSKPYTIELYEVYVKSLIANKQESKFQDVFLSKILRNLEEIYTDNSISEENYIDLIKTSYMFSRDVWAKKLRGLAINSYYGLNKSQLNIYSIIAGSVSPLIKPKLLKLIYKEKAQEVIDRYLQVENSSPTLYLQKFYINNKLQEIINMELPTGRKNKYLADLYFENNEYETAIELYKSVLEDDLGFNRLEVLAGIISSLISIREIEQALDLLVNNYFKNQNIIYKVDLLEVINNLELKRINSKNINIPILYSLYNTYISDDKEGARNDSYEDFLDSWGISNPSQLNIRDFENEKLIYFLRNICTPGIMATSISFDSQSEVETERLRICRKLSEIDPENIDIYSDEIKTITQKQMVRKGIREIENSKIYVDVEGIKVSLEKNLKENFIRYKSFGFGNKNVNPNYILIDKEINLMLPGDEKWNLFSNMVLEIRDSFVSSKEYGLDGYLSVGIRHGTLSGQLRGKIENEHLITQIDSVEQKYHDNNYWVERVGITKPELIGYLIKSLNDFSQSIDNLINVLKNELIQINIDNSKNENALFDYIITTSDLEYLDTLIREDTEYNEFVDIIIEYLWRRTDGNLSEINYYLKNHFKTEMNICFEKLQFDLDNLKDQVDIADLSNVIVRMKTEMQYEVDKISSWFSRRDPSEQSDYEIGLPIEIGLEMANNIYKNIKGYEITKKDIEVIPLKGKTFRGFVDVSFIIFENIFKHSGILEQQQIEISCYLENEKLIFNCINKISESIEIEALNKLMNEKKEKLKDRNVLEMVNKEGGSGFYKIHKIISIDLKCDIDMEFTYLDDFRFSITLIISNKGLLR
ncbi:hypothetical protein CN324_05250 [Bacillus anthracis]|nr:hypothetical protein CN324_05250 [Bacillus anthracis]PGX31442.1 hypothetical protein COE33_07000 [Bacillus anthracis]